MNSRERALKAFKRLPGLPDHVPVQFDLCRQLADHFGKELGIPVNYTDNPFEDVTYCISANELLIAMGSDGNLYSSIALAPFKPECANQDILTIYLFAMHVKQRFFIFKL